MYLYTSVFNKLFVKVATPPRIICWEGGGVLLFTFNHLLFVLKISLRWLFSELL